MKITQITKIPIQFRHNKNSFLRVNKLIVKVFSCKIQKLNVNGVFFQCTSIQTITFTHVYASTVTSVWINIR